MNEDEPAKDTEWAENEGKLEEIGQGKGCRGRGSGQCYPFEIL